MLRYYSHYATYACVVLLVNYTQRLHKSKAYLCKKSVLGNSQLELGTDPARCDCFMNERCDCFIYEGCSAARTCLGHEKGAFHTAHMLAGAFTLSTV